jgi:hypothetical protein
MQIRDANKHHLHSMTVILTLCRRMVNLIKYPLVPGRFKFFECSTPKCTIWLCRLVSYTYWQTHSQNSAWENDESRDRASKRVTEKATLVVARLQCVNNNNNNNIIIIIIIIGGGEEEQEQERGGGGGEREGEGNEEKKRLSDVSFRSNCLGIAVGQNRCELRSKLRQIFMPFKY